MSALLSVSILVCTFGSSEWRRRGLEALGAVEAHYSGECVAIHDPDLSLAQVRNVAALMVTGEWLCFVDADDALAPGYLEAMAETLDDWEHQRRHGWGMARYRGRPDGDPEGWFPLALLVPAVQYRDERGRPRGRGGIPAWDRSLLDLNCACIGTLIPRALFAEVGGFRDVLADGTPLPSLEDWELVLRLVRAGAKLVAVPDAVYVAQAGARRNADQGPYEAIRAEHGPGFDWANVAAYKTGAA